MKSFVRNTLLAFAACGAIGSALADTPKKPMADPMTVVELTASEVVLPTSANGTVVMRACATCELKSYPVTGATKYFIRRKAATLAELNASIAGQPLAGVGVRYSPKTGTIAAVKTVPTRPVAQP